MTDLRFAPRPLRKNPGAIAVAGPMPALGRGPNTPSFSVGVGVVPEWSVLRLMTRSWSWLLFDADACGLAMLVITGPPACRIGLRTALRTD